MNPSNPEYYQLENIRKMACGLKIKNVRQYNKRQLCILLGEEFKIQKSDGYPHVLTNVQTGEIQIFKSANALGIELKINHKIVLRKAQTGKTLVVDGVSYTIKKLY